MLWDRWTKLFARIPLPVRMLFAVWIFLSLAFDIGLPSSTANLSPLLCFLALLPMALVSFAISVFVLWSGCKTLFRASKSIVGDVPERGPVRPFVFNFVGGIGALNIYLIAYFLAAFGSARPLASYSVGIILSGLLSAGLATVLFKRGPHPKDVKIFLWGSLGMTAMFGIIMATIAVPPT